MILCNITFCVSAYIEQEFLQWIDHNFFTAESSALPAGARAVFSRVLMPVDMEEEVAGNEKSYALQWFADSETAVGQWFSSTFADRYGKLCSSQTNKLPYFVTLLQVLRPYAIS